MGNYEKPYELDASMIQTFPGGLFIAASAWAIDALKGTEAAMALGNSAFVTVAFDEEVPAHVVSAAKVLVLEVDPQNRTSLNRVAHVRRARPDLPIIAALRQANISVVRALIKQGVADVAELPFVPEELTVQVLDALAKSADGTQQAQLAPMVSVVRSSGGCGTTTVICHLAAALAELDTTGRGVCVVDLDLQGGDVASFLHATPNVNVAALLESGERLDEELLASAIVKTDGGFSLIAAPEVITPLDTVDIDVLLNLLALVRKKFGFVLLDLPADWMDWTLSIAAGSTELLLITDPSIASLRQAKRRLELFKTIGVDRGKIRVVLNRVERRLFKMIGVDEVREALNCDVLATLSVDFANLRSAQDQGVLVTEIAASSKFAGDIQTLAERLVAIGK